MQSEARLPRAPAACGAIALLVATACACTSLDKRPPAVNAFDPFDSVESLNLVEPTRAFTPTGTGFAVVHEFSSEIAPVLWQTEGLSLGEAVAVGQGPRDVVVVDWGGDGTSELCTADTSGGGLTVLAQSSDGLEVVAKVALDLPPNAISVANIDGDSVADVVVSLGLSDEGGVTVVSGATGAEIGQRVPLPFAGHAGVGDLDGDGDDDVAVCLTFQDRVAILRNENGKLVLESVLDTCAKPIGALIADLDGAPPSELVLACVGEARVLRAGETLLSLPVAGQLYDLAAADFDGTGTIDLAAVDVSEHALLVWPARAKLDFLAASSRPVARGPIALRPHDVDRDGDTDLALLAFEQRWLQVHLNAR